MSHPKDFPIPLTRDVVEFVPSGVISSQGVLSDTDIDDELLPLLLGDSHGASSHISISKEDAEAVYALLETAYYSSTPVEEYPTFDHIVTFSRPTEISTHLAPLKVAEWRVAKQARKELSACKGKVPELLSSMVLTTLQVDNLASSKEIVLSRQRGTYPHKIEFSLIRTLVRPKIVLTDQDETSQGTLNVATNCISRLRYILTYLPTTNTFKFLYSSSLCSVTDSVASKYLDIPNQKVMLDLLSQMFTQPLLELNRVA